MKIYLTSFDKRNEFIMEYNFLFFLNKIKYFAWHVYFDIK